MKAKSRSNKKRVEVQRNKATTDNNKPLKVDDKKVKKPKANKQDGNIKMDLTNIPRRSQKHLLYDWKKSVNTIVDYEYNGNKGQFIITDYEMDRKARKNKLKIYDKTNKKYYEMDSTTFRDGKFNLK